MFLPRSPSFDTFTLSHLPIHDLHLPHKQERACVPYSQHSSPSTPPTVPSALWEATGLTRSPALGLSHQRNSEAERKKHRWLTQLYQTGTDWLDLEFSFHDPQDTNSSGLSQETASHWKGEDAVRRQAGTLLRGRLGHSGMGMPPLTDDQCHQLLLPVGQTLYTLEVIRSS